MSENKIQEDEQIKNVDIRALEFDWIFYGDDSNSFIKTLAESKNDNLFEINTVKIVILFLWAKYFKRIFYLQLIPFAIYMIFYCVYVTYIYEMRLTQLKLHKDKNYKDTSNIVANWKNTYTFFVVVLLAFTGYFLIFEILQAN